MESSSTDPLPEPPQRKSGASKILAFFLGLSLFALTCIAALYFFLLKPAASAVSDASTAATAPLEIFRQALETVTNQSVSIEGSTAVMEKADVMELALIQRKTQNVVKYHTRWLISDNLLILKGDFIIKAGFDLSKSTEFTIENGFVSGHWPEAKILSVEMIDYVIYHSKNGSINKLQSQDHEAAVKALLAQARKDAQNSDLLKETQNALNKRLNDLSQGQFIWQAEPPN